MVPRDELPASVPRVTRKRLFSCPAHCIRKLLLGFPTSITPRFSTSTDHVPVYAQGTYQWAHEGRLAPMWPSPGRYREFAVDGGA